MREEVGGAERTEFRLVGWTEVGGSGTAGTGFVSEGRMGWG